MLKISFLDDFNDIEFALISCKIFYRPPIEPPHAWHLAYLKLTVKIMSNFQNFSSPE